MRFGLDRMRRMMTVLGSPERRFEAIHVLGTNGKSSTTRMTAAILERHGLRTGAYTSPHLVSYRERVLIGEREIDADAFADAVARAAWAAERVNRTLAEDDHVTQFELLTAAAFWEMAEREVEVAVVEAGLGGRYDATSVVDAQVTVLTNVGLEHTRWLGPTVTRHRRGEARRRCAEGATLVLGADLDAAGARGRRAGGRRAGRRDRAAPARRWRGWLLRRGQFQRRNFALARAAAEAYLEHAGAGRRSEQAVGGGGGRDRGPGASAGASSEDPLTVLDGAHNPHAVAALLRVAAGAASASARWRWCWACSRTRTRRAMLAALLSRERAGVVHRAAERPGAVAGGAAVARAPAGLRCRRSGAEPGAALERRGVGAGPGRRGAGDGVGVPGRRADGRYGSGSVSGRGGRTGGREG